MLKTNSFVDAIISIIKGNTSLTKVYSPDLEQSEVNSCCVTILSGGSSVNLCNQYETSPVLFRVLLRGGTESNDSDILGLSDDVFNALNTLSDVTVGDVNIITCKASSVPTFAYRDENNRILYNITFEAEIQ